MDLSPLWISLKIAFASTFLTVLIGIPIAWYVLRLERGQAIIDSILTLPMVLPPTVVGFFLLLLFGGNSPLGQFLEAIGFTIIFTWYGGVFAAFVVAFPLVYRSTRGAFEQLDPDLAHCAQTLGISEGKIFMRIMLPNARSGILSGVVLAFARSMGEFGATQMVAGNIPGRTRSMSLAVYSAVQNNNRPLAMQWSLIIVLISVVAMVLINKLSGVSPYKLRSNRKIGHNHRIGLNEHFGKGGGLS